MIEQYLTIQIATFFCVALEYDDLSGLTEEEIKLFQTFQARIKPNTSFNYGDEIELVPCDITKLISDCTIIKCFAAEK